MIVAFERVAVVLDRQSAVDRRHIMYFVKRASYELAFVVPETLQAKQREQACCHICFKTTCRSGAFILDGKNLVQFYEDLAGMMEYVRNEHEKSQAAAPQG
jgi:hypothetical protein